MKQPQLFVRVGRGRYAPIYAPKKGVDLYFWDESKGRIVPYTKASPPEPLRAARCGESSGVYKVSPTP